MSGATPTGKITGQSSSASIESIPASGRSKNRQIYILGAALTATASAVAGLGIYELILTAPLWFPPTIAFFATPPGWIVGGILLFFTIGYIAYRIFKINSQPQESLVLESKPFDRKSDPKQPLFSQLTSLENKYRDRNISDEELKEIKKEIGTLGQTYLEDDDLYSYISIALTEIKEIEKKREEAAEKLSASGPREFNWHEYDKCIELEEKNEEIEFFRPPSPSHETLTKAPDNSIPVTPQQETTLIIDWKKNDPETRLKWGQPTEQPKKPKKQQLILEGVRKSRQALREQVRSNPKRKAEKSGISFFEKPLF